MAVIELGKKYRTRSGNEVRIYAVDGSNPDVVHGAIKDKQGEWNTCCWESNGSYYGVQEDSRDLIEVGPYDHIKIGDPVLCWDEPDHEPLRRYFAGVNDKGRPLVFIDGATEWSSNGIKMDWRYCKKVEEI